MSIRAKMILIVVPLILTPLLVTAIVSSLSARNGITAVTTELLLFKLEELEKYAESQWSLLVENGLTGHLEFVDATRDAVRSFAGGLIRTDTELILAVDEKSDITLSTADVEIAPEELEAVSRLRREQFEGWTRLRLGDVGRVAQTASFAPFDWYILVTEQEDTFYGTVNRMFWQTGAILVGSLLVAFALLLVFSFYLINPLTEITDAMREIISTNDLSKRVDILYADETGLLGHTFNLMTGELDKAYTQIKSYALQAAVARTKEQKIRGIFQKYVPNDVIERYFANPESMLVGEDRELAVLFSDVRGFTTISERLSPNEIVESLNSYFALMVEVIMNRGGVVDKYIGDAIMAFYGAPVRHEDDALQAVKSGFEMLARLKLFNKRQREKGQPEFRIGIGLNFGSVTVGNIGSERKMDYTVVGDMVNLAERLEGLTKMYREPIIISEYVQQQIKGKAPCRLLDRVVVKGRTKGVGIYTTRPRLTEAERTAWRLHHAGIKLFYNREFEEASRYFEKVLDYLPNDTVSGILRERARTYRNGELPEDWDGSVRITTK